MGGRGGAPGRELSGEEGVPVGWEGWGGGVGLGEMGWEEWGGGVGLGEMRGAAEWV